MAQDPKKRFIGFMSRRYLRAGLSNMRVIQNGAQERT